MRLFILAILAVSTSHGSSDYPSDYPELSNDDHRSRGDQMDVNDPLEGDASDEYSGNYDYGDDYPTSRNEDKTVDKLHEYNEALVKLFGSEKELLSRTYSGLHIPTYLSFAESKLYIQQEVAKANKMGALNITERKQIVEGISILDHRMSELLQQEGKPDVLKKLVAEGPSLALVLPVPKVMEFLRHIHNKLDAEVWYCKDGFSLDIWKEIADAERVSPATAKHSSKAIASLLSVNQVAKGYEIHYSPKEEVKLLAMFSRNRNRMFVTKARGGVHEFENLIQDVICDHLTLPTMDRFLQKLTTFSLESGQTGPISDPADMTTMFEIQATLSEITADLATRPKSGVRTVNIGRHILNSYMDIVESSVGVKTANVWAQMPMDEVNEKLHHMLLRNERYVGSLSDVILPGETTDEANYTLEKESLSVTISKLYLEGNSSAEFQYEDAVIKADQMSSLDISDGDDLTVYTLRYKFWSRMIEEILGTHFEPGAGNSSESANRTRRRRSVEELVTVNDTASNKSFVGKGGIVSLSTRQKGVKRSVPVTYWIAFGEDSGGATHRCFSCEYLDSETVTWQTGGCQVSRVTDSGITCKCNHTTNFAAFMMPAEMMFDMTAQETEILKVVSLAGSFLSVFGLVLSLLVFFFVRNLVRNERLKAHAHLATSLLVVHIIFIFGEISLKNDAACVASTLFAHYFLLATFMWMLVEGIFLYLYVVQVFLRSKIASYNWMYVVGWGVPLLLVVVPAGYGIPLDVYVMPSDQEESAPQCPEGTVYHNFGEPASPKYARCWLSTKSGMIWGFLVPAILVLLFNTVIMCKTMTICLKSLRNSANMKARNKHYLPGGKYHSAISSDKYSVSNQYSDLYDKTGDGKTRKVGGYVVSGSPCLLQVTTEEEEKERKSRDGDSSSAASSKEHIPRANEAARLHAPSDENGSLGTPLRPHSVGGEPQCTTTDKRCQSVVYRNSISHNNSPKVTVKGKSFGSKMARLASERTKFFLEAKASLKGSIVLLPILGVPWICGLLAPLHQAFTFLFVILNSIQGLAIFVVYCLLNGEVRRAVQRRVAVHSTKHSVDAGIRRTSSTSTVRSFLRFGRRRSTVTTST